MAHSLGAGCRQYGVPWGIADAVHYAFMAACTLYGENLAIWRMETLEANSLVHFGMRFARRLFRTLGPAALTLSALVVVHGEPEYGSTPLHIIVILSGILCVNTIVLLIFFHAMLNFMRLARKAAAKERTSGAPHERNVRWLLWNDGMSITAMMFSSLLVMSTLLSGHFVVHSEEFRVFLWATIIADAVFNQWYALMLAGAIDGTATKMGMRVAAAKRQRQRWRRASRAWRRLEAEGSKERVLWDQKVHELAGRGFTLSALLKFYEEELPRQMPHFNPATHTTEDVVRGAIIPYSAPTRSSGAEVIMGSVPTVPEKLVTHNWANLFRDLVASVVADALGEGEYDRIVVLMSKEFRLLQRWIDELQLGSRTYWVCAFSVNQHKGICAQNPYGTRDSVTGQLHRTCSCGLTRAFNTTPPLFDGKSIQCEMNKFEDLMQHLSARNPSFEEVVAVDASFTLFSRAWCIAEIATAHRVGMPQCIKVCSKALLDDNQERLGHLRVQDMKASREEDRLAILASIEDKEAFNKQLNHMLFQELLPLWSSLAKTERMTVVGRAIRWHKAGF